VLSATLAGFYGLSSLLLPFLSEPGLHPGAERWIVLAIGVLQLAAAAAVFRAIGRRDLREAVLALAAWLFLNGAALLPAALRKGLRFDGAAWTDSAALLALPLIAAASAALAWRNPRPVLAAFLVTAPVAAGVVFTAAFAVMIAVWGF
jgi:hypothetical protein